MSEKMTGSVFAAWITNEQPHYTSVESRFDAEIAAAEERGRRSGVELLRECDEALKTAMGTVECMSRFPPGHEFAGRELLWHKLAVAVRAKIAALAPRDSGKES